MLRLRQRFVCALSNLAPSVVAAQQQVAAPQARHCPALPLTSAPSLAQRRQRVVPAALHSSGVAASGTRHIRHLHWARWRPNAGCGRRPAAHVPCAAASGAWSASSVCSSSSSTCRAALGGQGAGSAASGSRGFAPACRPAACGSPAAALAQRSCSRGAHANRASFRSLTAQPPLVASPGSLAPPVQLDSPALLCCSTCPPSRRC